MHTETDPGPLPMLAACALALAGIVHALLAVQFLLYWWLTGWHTAVVGAIGAGGVLAVAVAWRLGQGRSSAAVAGALLAPALGVLSAAWSAYALWHLSFALYMVPAPPSAALAALLAALAISPCRRSERALRALRARWGDGPLSRVLDA